MLFDAGRSLEERVLTEQFAVWPERRQPAVKPAVL